MTTAARWLRAKLKSAFDAQIDEHAIQSQPVSVLLAAFFFLQMIAVVILAAVYYASTSTTSTVIGPFDPRSIVVPTALQPVELGTGADFLFASTSVLNVSTTVLLFIDGSAIVPTPDWCGSFVYGQLFIEIQDITASSLYLSVFGVFADPVSVSYLYLYSPGDFVCQHQLTAQYAGLQFRFIFTPDNFAKVSGQPHFCPSYGTSDSSLYVTAGATPGVCMIDRQTGSMDVTRNVPFRPSQLNLSMPAAELDAFLDDLCWSKLMQYFVPHSLLEQLVGHCKAAYPTSTLYFNTLQTHRSWLEVLSLTFSAVALVYSVTLWTLRRIIKRWKQQHADRQMTPAQRTQPFHEMTPVQKAADDSAAPDSSASGTQV